jgi:hypothetical protein
MPQVKAASPQSATTCSCRPQIARGGHAERGGKRRARVTRAVAVVLAFGAEHEAVEAVGLADGVETVAAAGEQLVDVGLVADVEDEARPGA